jgi:hypothetical protein
MAAELKHIPSSCMINRNLGNDQPYFFTKQSCFFRTGYLCSMYATWVEAQKAKPVREKMV